MGIYKTCSAFILIHREEIYQVYNSYSKLPFIILVSVSVKKKYVFSFSKIISSWQFFYHLTCKYLLLNIFSSTHLSKYFHINELWSFLNTGQIINLSGQRKFIRFLIHIRSNRSLFLFPFRQKIVLSLAINFFKFGVFLSTT